METFRKVSATVFSIFLTRALLSSRLTGPLSHIRITSRWWNLSNVSLTVFILAKTQIQQVNLEVKPTLCYDFSSPAGSYVALTVLGRPPGLAQIPLSEAESEMLGVSISSPNSPAAERPYSPLDRLSFTQPTWVLKTLVDFGFSPPQTCFPYSHPLNILTCFIWVSMPLKIVAVVCTLT